MTAIHFPTDPVPALPITSQSAAATRPRLLQRFFRWIDDGLADVGVDD